MKKLIPFLLAFPAAVLFASVSLDVGTDVKVETSGGVFVELDGDLTETGTGYFSGKIASGSRTGMTSFAGLSLGTGMDGSATRLTGSAYAKGHGEGTNFKRYFELSNTGTGAVTTTMKITYVGSGANDEQNGLSGPYYIYRYASSWTGYGPGVSASPNKADGLEIPTGSSDWVLSEGVRISAKLFLEGPYKTAGDTMTVSLAASLPLTSPYSQDVRTVASIPGRVVDWVLLQVRSTENGTILASRSCFMRSNGLVVADDGSSNFVGLKVSPGNYYTVLRHRNHLAAMTSGSLTGLTWGVTPSAPYDFSTGTDKYYGADAILLETGVYGQYAGDADGLGGVDASDRSATWNNRNKTGYETSDCDLSGTVDASDRSITWNNRNKTTSVP